MIELLALAGLLIAYAVGCAATIVELHQQERDQSIGPSAGILAQRFPKIHVLTIATMVVLWPFLMVWTRVREYWR